MQQEIINLGKQLVQRFASERHGDVDLLSRWMAHYIEQQMTAAEVATGAEKVAAEERCFRTILSLWQHRSTLPDGRRPFESFEPILEALARLHPDEERPYYLSSRFVGQAEEQEGTVSSYVNLALGTDIAARAVIDLALAEATKQASSPALRAWLENAVSARMMSDIRASEIQVVVELRRRADELNINPESGNENARKTIQRRLEQLEAFVGFAQSVRDEIANKLASSSVESPTD